MFFFISFYCFSRMTHTDKQNCVSSAQSSTDAIKNACISFAVYELTAIDRAFKQEITQIKWMIMHNRMQLGWRYYRRFNGTLYCHCRIHVLAILPLEFLDKTVVTERPLHLLNPSTSITFWWPVH